MIVYATDIEVGMRKSRLELETLDSDTMSKEMFSGKSSHRGMYIYNKVMITIRPANELEDHNRSYLIKEDMHNH
jgi:hypothetical protein